MITKKSFLGYTLALLTTPAIILSPLNSEKTLAHKTLNLSNRYDNDFVNGVFKDNILLTLFYLRHGAKSARPDWTEVRKPFRFLLTLEPGDLFSFHEDVLKEFEGKKIRTTNGRFGSDEGFKSDGYLVGDGVCHIASFINMVAREAQLFVKSPTNHDFAPIPEVSREFGTSIYFQYGAKTSNALQNLYVLNNSKNTIGFLFEYDGKNALGLKIIGVETRLTLSAPTPYLTSLR